MNPTGSTLPKTKHIHTHSVQPLLANQFIMDSTPPATPIQPQPISSFKPPSSSKLPIKRKDSFSSPSIPNPKSPILKFEPITPDYLLDDDPTNDVDPTTLHVSTDPRPPPFKFHRIWTEPDEIRFLQGLLECSNEPLSFPRDLGIFYSRFSNTMSQPYTKSQLSEKIRRLRKKFRVVSSRLAKGLDKSLLSPHDRSLYELSRQLWHTDYASTSPFFNSGGGNSSVKPIKSNLVGVKVSFSPVILHSVSTAVLALPSVGNQEMGMGMGMVQNLSGVKIVDYEDEDNDNDNDNNNNENENGFEGFGNDVKLSEVNVEFESGVAAEEIPVNGLDLWGEVKCLTRKAFVDAFDQSVEEVRMAFDRRYSSLEDCLKGEKQKSFEKRSREQRVGEFEVLAKRLRLMAEHSVQRQ